MANMMVCGLAGALSAFAWAVPASAQTDEFTAPFTTCAANKTYFSNRTEMECRTVRVDAERCRAFRQVNFIGWAYEADALRKAQATGERSLDVHDRKWLQAHLGRKAACEALLKRVGD